MLAAILLLDGCTLHASETSGKPKRFELINTDVATSDAELRHEDYPELYKAIEDNFQSEYIIINTYTMHLGYNDAESFILTRMRYVQKAKKLRELLPAALNGMYEKAAELYSDSTVTHTENIVYPKWQYLAAVLPYAETEQYLLYNIMHISIDVEESGNGSVSISVNAEPVHIYDFALARAAEVPSKDKANTYLDIRYTYAYLSALYDDEGNYTALPYYDPMLDPAPTAAASSDTTESGLSQPTSTYYPFEQSYKDRLVYPLDTVPVFHDTWAQARSNNTRQHMGTDIRNKEWSNIYSCSDGTVLYTGYDDIPGNYVIIMDDMGYEYHYYHLVEIPSEVKAGDKVKAGTLIAHVGDTGNSDASHLHISIIGPDGVFINPYKLMRELAQSSGK